MSPGTLERLDKTLEEQRTRAAAAADTLDAAHTMVNMAQQPRLDAAHTMLNIARQPREFNAPPPTVPGQTQVAQAANQHLPADRSATPRTGGGGALPYDPVRAASQASTKGPSR
ncbi:hypothetical protein [Streptomyces fumanus]|uniref:hypothetical protein n=1 Tax=Streptomyces fumanus TaxID=67302 RepID=UPI0033E149C3